MVWLPKISLNEGRYVIRPFECKIIGKAEGSAKVRASIHTLITAFDDEEWRIITLFVNHLDSKLKYTDLFAASCGSLGDFTDIKERAEGFAMTRQMKHFNFPIRNPDGTFYAQVHPFDPSYFAVKVHPTGALLFTPHHSQLTLLQHIIIQSPYLKQPVHFLSDIPKYWIEDDGTMCLDDSHRWKSAETIAWLRTRGLHSVPNSIKADIGDLVYNGPKSNALDKSAALAPFFFLDVPRALSQVTKDQTMKCENVRLYKFQGQPVKKLLLFQQRASTKNKTANKRARTGNMQ